MKNMIFVEISEDQILGQGVVAESLGKGFFRLTWRSNPPISRVVSPERMESMLLFNNVAEMQTWLESVTAPADDSEGDTEKKPDGKKPAPKKPAPKKPAPRKPAPKKPAPKKKVSS